MASDCASSAPTHLCAPPHIIHPSIHSHHRWLAPAVHTAVQHTQWAIKDLMSSLSERLRHIDRLQAPHPGRLGFIIKMHNDQHSHWFSHILSHMQICNAAPTVCTLVALIKARALGPDLRLSLTCSRAQSDMWCGCSCPGHVMPGGTWRSCPS